MLQSSPLPSQLSGRFVKLEQTHSFSVHVISWQPTQVREADLLLPCICSHMSFPTADHVLCLRLKTSSLFSGLAPLASWECIVGVTDTTHKIGRIASEPFCMTVSQSVCRNEMVCLDKVRWNKGEPSGSMSYI